MCYNRFLSCYNRFFNCYNKVLICYNKLKKIILVALPSFCRDCLLLFFSYSYISFYLIKLYIVPVFVWFFFLHSFVQSISSDVFRPLRCRTHLPLQVFSHFVCKYILYKEIFNFEEMKSFQVRKS